MVKIAKKAFVYDGSQWVDIAQSTADLSTYQKINRTGLNVVVPTSVSVGSGSYALSTNGQVTFTSANNISLIGCFSAAYDTYKVILNSSARIDGADAWTSMQLLDSSTPVTSNYGYSRRYDYSTGAGAQEFSNTASGFTNVYHTNIGGFFSTSEISYPFLAQPTFHTCQSSGTRGTATKLEAAWSFGTLSDTSSHNGLKIILGGNSTGTIRIYGYNNGA